MSGPGRLVLISGEAGIGKTALTRELGSKASQAGMATAWGRSWEGGGAPPFWPWTEVLRSVLADPASGPPIGELEHVQRIARLGVAGPPEQAEVPALGSSEQTRFAAFDAVARYLAGVSAGRPLFIALEDLHAADESSLLLLTFVSRQLRGIRAVVVGTFRSQERNRRDETHRVLEELGNEALTLELEGLDEEAIAQLLERISGTAPSPQVVGTVTALSGGNPLFAQQLGRVLRREGRLQDPDSSLRASPGLPRTVRDTLARRLESLSPRALELLEAGAVCGERFAVGVLRELVGDEDSPSDVLDGLVKEGVLEHAGTGQFRFTHSLLREALRDTVPPVRRAQLHKQIADILANQDGGNAGSHLAEIAHHSVEAVVAGASDPGAVRVAFERSVRAGEHAHRQLAFEDAVAQYEQALGISSRMGPRQRCEVLIALGGSRIAAGRVDEATVALKEAAQYAREMGSWEMLARVAITLGEKPAGGLVDHELIALIEEALEHLPPGDSEERSRLLARLGLELVTSPDFERRHATVRAAVEIARRSGSTPALVAALNAKGFSLLAPDVVEESVDSATELVQIGRRLRDPAIQSMALCTALQGLLQLGRTGEFEAGARDLDRAAAASRQTLHVWASVLVRGTRAQMRGEFEEASRLAEEAAKAGAGLPNALPAFLNQTFAVAHHRGGIEPMEPTLRKLAEEHPLLRTMWEAALCLVLAASERQNEVAEVLRGLVPQLAGAPRGAGWFSSVAWAADATETVRAVEHAAPLQALLARFSHLHVAMTMRAPSSYWGSVRLRLGALATLLRRFDEAEEQLNLAVEEHRRMGSLPYVAHAQASLADMLLARRRRQDRRRALELLVEAARTAERLGMAPLARRIEALRERAEVGSSPVPGPVLRLEGEFWTVAFGGSVSRLRDSKGLRYLSELVRAPTREHHVLDLMQSVERLARGSGDAAGAEEAGLRSGSTRGEQALDADAKAAYKQRLEELQHDLEEAESWRDAERADRARREIEFISGELASAMGMKGRDRRMTSAAEQARINVTKAIRSAMRRIDESNPALGRHLRDTVRTGRFCSYGEPGETLPAWSFD